MCTYIIEYHIHGILLYMCICIYVSTSYINKSFIDELDWNYWVTNTKNKLQWIMKVILMGKATITLQSSGKCSLQIHI